MATSLAHSLDKSFHLEHCNPLPTPTTPALEICIRGFFHVYQDTWIPVIGELHCARKGKSIYDSYVVVVKNSTM